MLFLPGFSAQEVVMLEMALPLLAAVLGRRAKLMLLPEFTITVSDSFKVALNTTVAMLELPGAASASRAENTSTMETAANKANLRIMTYFSLSLRERRNG